LEEDDRLRELADTIRELEEENTLLKDKMAIGQWDASEIEKIDAEELIKDLRSQIKVLELDNKALRDSRDMFQNRNAELLKTVKTLQSKLKKAGIE
jgi:MFS superfamily sulfate permease-like transporter